MESLFGDEEDERFADEYLLILSFAFDKDGTYIVDSFREERNARYETWKNNSFAIWKYKSFVKNAPPRKFIILILRFVSSILSLPYSRTKLINNFCKRSSIPSEEPNISISTFGRNLNQKLNRYFENNASSKLRCSNGWNDNVNLFKEPWIEYFNIYIQKKFKPKKSWIGIENNASSYDLQITILEWTQKIIWIFSKNIHKLNILISTFTEKKFKSSSKFREQWNGRLKGQTWINFTISISSRLRTHVQEESLAGTLEGEPRNPLSRGPPFVRPSNCAPTRLCGVHGEVDKRDKCGGLYTPFDERSRRREGRTVVELAPNTYGPPFVLRAFLSAPCQPINASFPVYGAFWRVYAANVDPAPCVFIECLRFIRWREIFRAGFASVPCRSIVKFWKRNWYGDEIDEGIDCWGKIAEVMNFDDKR